MLAPDVFPASAMSSSIPPPSRDSPTAARSWPLRHQLLALSLAIALPLVALFAYELVRDFENDRNDAGQQALELAGAAAANAADIVHDARRMLVALSNRPAIRALDPARCDPLLPEIHMLFPNFANALVVNREGEVVCSSVAPPPGAGIRLDPDKIFNRLRESRKFTVGKPARGSITGRWVVVLAQPILDARGEFLGAVALPLDLLALPLLPARLALPGNAIAAIGTYDGTVIARSHDAANFVGRSTRESRIRAAALAAPSGHLEVTGLDGTERVYGFSPVPGTDWYALAGLPSSAVYAQDRARLVRSTVLGVAIVLLTMALGFAVARRIERPIRRLAGVADAVAGGERAARAPQGGGSEMQTLAASFNAMLDALERSDAERARLQEIVERTSDIIIIATPDRSIVYMNRAARALLGLRPGDRYDGLKTTQAYPPGEDEQVVQVARRHALEHGQWAGEIRLLSHDGREIPALQVLLALKDERGELACFAGISRDISERKRAENALRESEQRFRLAASSGHVWDWNIATDSFLFPAEFWGRLGYGVQEVGDQREMFAAIIHPEDVALWKKSVEDHVVRRIPYDFDFRARAKSGEYRHFNTTGQAEWNADGRATYMAGTTFDITRRKRAEDLLQGQKRVLEMVATGAPLEATLDALMRSVEASAGGMLASILLMDPDGLHLRHGAAPSLPQAFVRGVDGQPIGERAGSCGTAAYRRTRVVVEDIATSELWESYRPLAEAHGLRACWSTPLFDAGRRVLGTFALYFHAPVAPTPAHLQLIETVAGTAAIAIVRNREMNTLRETANSLERLSHRLIGIQEGERARIARELHDELGQALSAAKIRLQSAKAGADLTPVVGIIDLALSQVRGMSLDLYPPQLDDLGLAAALRALVARNFGERLPRIALELAEDLPAIPRVTGLAAYRIAQEALGNAVRHAGPAAIRITLGMAQGALVLVVADEGSGFEPAAEFRRARSGGSLGLLSMEERAKLAGGELSIHSSPDSGTTITARLPV